MLDLAQEIAIAALVVHLAAGQGLPVSGLLLADDAGAPDTLAGSPLGTSSRSIGGEEPSKVRPSPIVQEEVERSLSFGVLCVDIRAMGNEDLSSGQQVHFVVTRRILGVAPGHVVQGGPTAAVPGADIGPVRDELLRHSPGAML